MMMAGYSKLMSNAKLDRMATLVLGDIVVVVSKFKGTLNDVPPSFPGFPMFPGTPVNEIKGKSFQDVLAIDLHVLDQDGKLKREWHIEDWSEALSQMLTGEPPASLELEHLESGEVLTEVPQCIVHLYDKILNEKDVFNVTLHKKLVHDDWVSRPNLSNPQEKGPGLIGLKQIAGYFLKLIPDFIIDRKATLLHEDKVIVLSEISGTIAGALPGFNELPQFPGIPVEKLIGKKFKSMALDIHKIVDGKVKQSYHIEDWQTALAQMLNGTPAPDFGFDRAFIDF